MSFSNLLAKDTSRAFARNSSSLSFVRQEMTLNIDINRILPGNFCGVSPDLRSELLTSSLNCNVSLENVPLNFHWPTVDQCFCELKKI